MADSALVITRLMPMAQRAAAKRPAGMNVAPAASAEPNTRASHVLRDNQRTSSPAKPKTMIHAAAHTVLASQVIAKRRRIEVAWIVRPNVQAKLLAEAGFVSPD